MPDRRTVIEEAYDLPNGKAGIPLEWNGAYVILGELDRWQTWRLPVASLGKPHTVQGDGKLDDKEWRAEYGS